MSGPKIMLSVNRSGYTRECNCLHVFHLPPCRRAPSSELLFGLGPVVSVFVSYTQAASPRDCHEISAQI